MISEIINPSALAPQYASANPFPHAVIDSFLDHEIASALADDLEHADVQSWSTDEHQEQVNKWVMSDLAQLTQTVGWVLSSFNTAPVLRFFEQLTGIAPLIGDPTFTGGGVHVSATGGRLGIHADFNLHPQLKLHRRLNALLFLNRDWEPEWNGQTELWNTDLTECVQRIDPIFNRLVVFNVTDSAFHGVPDFIRCPNDRRRISLALYYYTFDRPDEEKGPFHWAAWQQPQSANIQKFD
jgi:Rps23 Pro-64 3,4-dihydroxylase Tpa1-like proline 4-hydroxylase